MPPNPDQAPIARERSSVANDACRIARLPGVSSAPPMPCTARAAINTSMFGAAAQASDAIANQATPSSKIRRRPMRSPSVPPSSRNAARVNVYAATTHCRLSTPALKSLPMCGSAMPTTVASSEATPEPRIVAVSTQRPARTGVGQLGLNRFTGRAH